MTGRYHVCHVVPKPPRSEANAVDGGGEGDHTAEPEPVAEEARAGGGDDVAGSDRGEDRGRRPERLAEADGEVEDDERACARERPLPGRVRDQESPHVRLAVEDPPAVVQVGADALEDAAVAPVLAHEQDRRRARRDDDKGRDEERERLPDVEERAAADQRRAERGPAHQVLGALGAAVDPLRQQVGVEAAVGRLVDVVGEEEREDEQRRRPEARHERHQREAEPDRAERDEHERAPAAERGVERVAPRADDQRQRDREEPFRREDERDQGRRGRELPEQRRQVGRRRRQREREPEGAEAERPDDPAVAGLRRALLPRPA